MFIVKRLLWSLRRALGLSPTQRTFKDLRTRNVRTGDLAALEVFGHTGFLHTLDYARKVSSLEVWEIDATKERDLRRNLPQAKVKIGDSFDELKRTPGRFDLLVVDNPVQVYGDHCEHFDLFPDIFRVAKDSSILILNVAGNPWPRPDEAHLARRRAFYKTDHPENVPFDRMIATYRNLLHAGGFELEWFFTRRRTWATRASYLVLKIGRKEPLDSSFKPMPSNEGARRRVPRRAFLPALTYPLPHLDWESAEALSYHAADQRVYPFVEMFAELASVAGC